MGGQMPNDFVLTIGVLLLGVVLLFPFRFQYSRATEEKGRVPIFESRCGLRSCSAFAIMIRGGPWYRISLYDDLMVIGMIGIFRCLGQYIIPYKQIIEVKL